MAVITFTGIRVVKVTRAKKRATRSGGFLGRLLRNRAGNTLVIAGAAMIPMAALAGSAVDMSRLYLVKARLQQACDAGVLAGRRFMTGADFTADAQTQANSYFNFNFPTGSFGTTSNSFTPVRTANGQVAGTAEAVVPMVVMYMFGMTPKTLDVACEAKFEIANTDVMFVLDVTGSMACAENSTSAQCDTYQGTISAVQTNGKWQMPQTASSRFMALRTAIKSFYDTLNGAISTDARLRIGFAPYASSVNVGARIREMNTNYFVDEYAYQSRAREHDGTYVDSTSTGNWEVHGTPGNYGSYSNHSDVENQTSSQCPTSPQPADEFSNPRNTSNSASSSTDSYGVVTVTTTYQQDVTRTNYRKRWGVDDTSGTERDCDIDKRTRNETQRRVDVLTRTPNYRWRYEPRTQSVTGFLAGNAVTTRTGNIPGTVFGNTAAQKTHREGTNVTSTWSGCIQERRTVAGDEVDVGDTNVHDLNIDLIPSSDETRWKPSWPEITYNRQQVAGRSTYTQGPTDDPYSIRYRTPHGSNTKFSCPKAAQRLQVMTRAQIDTYVDANDFAPHGGTYHDIGLVWGARMLSPNGIFAVDNVAAPNGGSTQRHIIFMTDGDMAPNNDTYGSYGIEQMEGRVGGGSADAAELKNRHNHRFLSLCQAIKDRGITLWVVAYGQALTDELDECATDGLAFAATSGAALQTQFQAIASRIADLRLER